jgi:GDP-L-fucose synthase
MKILVLGSNGLVGSSVVKKLNTVEDKKLNIFASTRKDTNLFSLEDTKSLINSFKPNVIVNAAAKVGGILANNEQRTEFILENLKINMNLLESIVEKNHIKLINLGSSCIYPLDAPNPIKESSLMTGKLEPTNSPYAMAKICAIEIGDSLSKQYGHRINNLMPTNLYGPNDHFSEKDSHVIPGLFYRLESAKKNKEDEFKVWGTGTPLREFLFNKDLADAIYFVINNDIRENLINVGSGFEISIKKLVYMINELVQYRGNIVFDSSLPDGNPRKLLDTSLLDEYGWVSKTKFDEGLEATYEWFKENIKV